MIVNVGNVDRGVRLAVGVVLIALALFSGMGIFDGAVVKYGVVIVGLILIITGLIRLCPIYSILGIGARKV